MKKYKLDKLKEKAYRDAYVGAHISQGLAFQIKALREQRGWTQTQLADNLGLKGQSSVVRYEDPSYGKLSLAKLKELGAVFDVGLLVRFVPYSRFLSEISDPSDTALRAKSFDQELPLLIEDCSNIGQYHPWHWDASIDIDNSVEMGGDFDTEPDYMDMLDLALPNAEDSEYVID